MNQPEQKTACPECEGSGRNINRNHGDLCDVCRGERGDQEKTNAR